MRSLKTNSEAARAGQRPSNEIIFAEQKIGAVGHKEIRTDNTTPSGGQSLLEANVDVECVQSANKRSRNGAELSECRCTAEGTLFTDLVVSVVRSRRDTAAVISLMELQDLSMIEQKPLQKKEEERIEIIWCESAALWAPGTREEREGRSFLSLRLFCTFGSTRPCREK